MGHFVSSDKSPLKALCTKWILSLNDSEIEQLTREDEEAVSKREHYAAIIERLTKAHEIATKASEETEHLTK
jgi:hypothetical protein